MSEQIASLAGTGSAGLNDIFSRLNDLQAVCTDEAVKAELAVINYSIGSLAAMFESASSIEQDKQDQTLVSTQSDQEYLRAG